MQDSRATSLFVVRKLIIIQLTTINYENACTLLSPLCTDGPAHTLPAFPLDTLRRAQKRTAN